MAPATGSTGFALPSLTDRVGGGAGAGSTIGGAGTDPDAVPGGTTAPGTVDPNATTPGAPAPAAGANPLDAILAPMAATPWWMGPLMTVAGGALAIKGFTGGGNMWKFSGISTALSGIAMTVIGNKARGMEEGKLVGAQQVIAEIEPAVMQQKQQYEAEIARLQAAIAAQDPNGTGGTPAPDGTTPAPDGTTPTPDGTTTGPALPTGQWAPAALIGSAIDLDAAAMPSGTVVAAKGSFAITSVIGDPAGYATMDEANTAAKAQVSTEVMGTAAHRWLVLEHGGRFYALDAQLDESGQAAKLNPQNGTVVAWHSLDHLDHGADRGWMAYSWSATTGPQYTPVAYGATPFEGATTQAGTSGTAPTPGTAGTTPTTTTGGGPVAFDPATVVGRTFPVNASATADGTVARGGSVQLQSMVEESAGGFGTAEEAATVARRARQSNADQWGRVVTMQGADNRFYVFRASVVARETAPVAGAAPVHIFGAGFAEYYDAATSAWKAVADAAA